MNGMILLLLTFLFGSFGVHRFVMGKYWSGFIILCLTAFCGLGVIFAIIDFFFILFISDQELNQFLEDSNREWY
jgi:TM2 domain-containing membrane protein YozV